jgi:uncharacterized protein (TIGR03437 family)
MQINLQIPSAVTPGPAIPVIVTIGNGTSNTVMLTIQ